MSVTDKFFFAFFLSNFFLATVLDSTGLKLSHWPPAPVKAAISAYCDMLDPLFCAGQRWLQTMLALEAIMYPPYIIATLFALLRGIGGTTDAYEIATVVWATMNAYSVVTIATEALVGDPRFRSPAPALFVAMYAPFVFLPLAFLWHVYSMRRPVLTGAKRN